MLFRRPRRYRDVLPALVTLTLCVAAFFFGAHIGGDRVHAELMALVPDEEFDIAAQFSGGVPLFEVVVACVLALVLFVALKLILEVVEANED